MDPQRRDAARGAAAASATAWSSSPRTTPSSRPRSRPASILLGDGRPVADATPAEVLAGGWYFATQVARVLGGAGGALTPEQGAALSPRAAVRRELDRGLDADPRRGARRRLRLVRAHAPDDPRARAGRDARRDGRARPRGVRGAAQRQADDRHRADRRLHARRRARVHGRRGRRARLEPVLRPGTVDAVADGRLGRRRAVRRGARARQPRRPRPRSRSRSPAASPGSASAR